MNRRLKRAARCGATRGGLSITGSCLAAGHWETGIALGRGVNPTGASAGPGATTAYRAQRNGKRLDTGCCIVFEVKDGRIVDGREHFYDLHNWDPFWS